MTNKSSYDSDPTLEPDKWAWLDRSKFETIVFGIVDKDTILQQLSDSNKLIMPKGLRGAYGQIRFEAKVKSSFYHYKLWLTNDERRKLIGYLKSSPISLQPDR